MEGLFVHKFGEFDVAVMYLGLHIKRTRAVTRRGSGATEESTCVPTIPRQ